MFFAISSLFRSDVFKKLHSIAKNIPPIQVIVVAMGKNLRIDQLSQLSYGSGFTFAADYGNLSSLASAINKAICADPPTSCGV